MNLKLICYPECICLIPPFINSIFKLQKQQLKVWPFPFHISDNYALRLLYDKIIMLWNSKTMTII